MVIRILHNTKWRLLLYFLGTSLFSLVSLWVAWMVFQTSFIDEHFWPYWFMFILIGSLTIGYVAAHRIQQRIDDLYINMLQAVKGNLSVRLIPTDDPLFSRIYDQFNDMMRSFEAKLKIMQTYRENQIKDRELSNAEAVLEERKRIARDLHDTVSQQLFAIHLAASSLPKALLASGFTLPEGEQQFNQILTQLTQMSSDAQHQVRSLIAQLRPFALEGRSLCEVLQQWFPEYCSQFGLQGKLDTHGCEDMSEAIEHQLFLTIQEALYNVVKHAQATFVSLSMSAQMHRYVLMISDDGVGFDHNRVRLGTYGLHTMQERIDKLGGTIDIISKPGAGTTIRVYIPKFSKDTQKERQQNDGSNQGDDR